MTVAAKSQSVAKQQGAAAISLLEGAVKLAQQSSPVPATPGVGARIDVKG